MVLKDLLPCFESLYAYFRAPFFIFLVLLGIGAFAFQQLPRVNFSTGPYVRDESGTLTAGQYNELSGLIDGHNRKGLGRFFVLIINNLPDETTLEQFAKAKINEEPRSPNERFDRILVLIVMGEHKIRIETSRDVWPLLPDDYCHTVIMQIMSPAFKKSDYYSGIYSAIEALAKKLTE